jgi:hypothetical protein
MTRIFGGVLAVGFLLAVTDPSAGQVAKRFKTKIVNGSGETIYVAIVGHKPGVISRPGGDGTLAAAGRNKEYTDDLFGGDRVVMVWDRHGELLWIGGINVDAPGTIKIGKGGEIIYSGLEGKAKKSTPYKKADAGAK